MPKYVVVDWGLWGIETQSSSKIIIADPFDVREGNECSLQGKDPATKRPMLFHGHVLAVFGKFIRLLFFSLHRFRTVVQQSFGKNFCTAPYIYYACRLFNYACTLLSFKTMSLSLGF